MQQIIEFAGGHPLLAAAVVISALAVIVYELRLKAQGVTQIPATTAVQLINKGATIVDVRDASAYAAGHIVNARNVPLASLEEAPEKALKKSAKKTYLTVCENGPVAARAANALRKAGFETVFSIQGGLAAWRAASLPVVTDPGARS